MKRSLALILTLAACAGSTAQAATYDLTYFFDGDGTPGGGSIRNINDMPVHGTGTLEIRDEAIAPGGLVTFASGDILGFTSTFTDSFGVSVTYDYLSDPNNLATSEFGARFDENGVFERFDSPSSSTCAGVSSFSMTNPRRRLVSFRI